MSKKGIAGFALGALAGIGLGALLSPKSGKENREELVKRLNVLKDRVKEIDVKEVKKSFEDKIIEVQDSIEDLDREKVASIAKKKANDLKKKSEELYELAKEKGTPYVQDAAEKLREKAVVVTKDVLKKLEKKEK